MERAGGVAALCPRPIDERPQNPPDTRRTRKQFPQTGPFLSLCRRLSVSPPFSARSSGGRDALRTQFLERDGGGKTFWRRVAV